MRRTHPSSPHAFASSVRRAGGLRGLLPWLLLARLAHADYAHFEARHTHPIGLSPGGDLLLALNSPDGRLSVFDVSDPARVAPVLVAEIPVGLEPVSLRARTESEVWVVNELSDSVSVVSLSTGAVIDTLDSPDEPADVVFAQGRAFVSCARSDRVRVFDAVTRAKVADIALQGVNPRALAVSPSGDRVYAAFQLSGNRTTILPHASAPAQPAPTNPALPAAPRTGLIVPASDARIAYTVLDHDVAEIDPVALTVTRVRGGVGNNLFDLAPSPDGSTLWVANIEALNLVRFEPNLRGHAIDSRLTALRLADGAVTHHDLNPGVNYSLLPNSNAQAIAMSQPMALAVDAAANALWVAAFASDRVARLTTNGVITTRADLRRPGEESLSSRRMRGPRGLALHAGLRRLYVLNKLSNSVSVLDAEDCAWLAEVPVGSHDPMPASIREGRGFLFDARLSGNGTFACGACHLDADRDGIAWDLGDPGGEMFTGSGFNFALHGEVPQPRVMHPMKGPMVTQSLRGIKGHAPFHWRGDKPSLADFNPTFANLMGGTPLPAADMAALSTYIESLGLHPNPNRNLDRTLPGTLAGGNTLRGLSLYLTHNNHCAVCHILPAGTDDNIDLHQEVGSTQPMKNPSLRTVYQRMHFRPVAGQRTVTGFGLLHDGTGFDLPIAHPYVLHELQSLQDYYDVLAYVLAFDTGTAPMVGRSRTLTPANRTSAPVLDELGKLELSARKATPDGDLVARGSLAGVSRSWRYLPAQDLYQPDRAGEPALSRPALLARLAVGDVLTFTGVPFGQGASFGGDRDGDGTTDGDEPRPSVALAFASGAPLLSWMHDRSDWTLEGAATLDGPWRALGHPHTSEHDRFTHPAADDDHRFFRLNRSW